MSVSPSRIRIAPKAIVIRDEALLLVECRDERGRWYLLPGGGQEHGEPLDAALRRECREEIGCDVELGPLVLVRDYIVANHEFAHVHDGDEHQVELMFACTLPPGAEPRVGADPDGMQTGVAWVGLRELHRHRVYPTCLAELLHDGLPTEPITLGDVN